MQGKPRKEGQAPQLSVVMPVYNALPYLDAAVESILAQTFADFEFVILDDASTDGSTERLRHWASRDRRIRLVEVEENLGPARSSQVVASAAAAPIVARMDADDISLPERFREQMQTLKTYPTAGVVGCLFTVIDSNDRRIRNAEPWRLLRRSAFLPFPHGSIMYRRSVFEQVGGYRKECVFWEDHDLLTRMSAVSDVLVIPRPLFRYRQSINSTRFTSGYESIEQALDLMYRCIDQMAEGRNYDELLARPEASDAKIDPRSYIALGSVILWGGRRPNLLRRLLDRGRLSPDFASLSAIVWTAWASLSPGTLRPFLLMLANIRNAVAKRRIRSSAPVPWRPREATAAPSHLAAADTGGSRASPTQTKSAGN